MAVRPVLKMGHPVLKQVAAPVERFGTRELAALVEDLDDTMRAMNGAGLAAPQIGVSLRVVVFEVLRNPRYPRAEEVPYTASDLAAYARTLASKRHRSVPLAEQAVLESKAFTDQDARSAEPPLIDIVARDLDDLLRQLDGRTVVRFDGSLSDVGRRQAATRVPSEA